MLRTAFLACGLALRGARSQMVSSSTYISGLEEDVRVSVIRNYIGYEKGPVACYNRDGLLGSTLSAFGLTDVTPDAKDYFLFSTAFLQNPTFASPGTVADLIIPPSLLGGGGAIPNDDWNVFMSQVEEGLRAQAADLHVDPDTDASVGELVDLIVRTNEQRANDIAITAQQRSRSLLQRERKGYNISPMETNLAHIISFFHLLSEDSVFQKGFLRYQELVSKYEPEQLEKIEQIVSAVYSQRTSAPLNRTRGLPADFEPPTPPKKELIPIHLYLKRHRKFLFTRSVQGLVNSLMVMDHNKERRIIIYGIKKNVAGELCRVLAESQSLQIPAEEGAATRCAMQTALTSMLACGDFVVDCAPARDWLGAGCDAKLKDADGKQIGLEYEMGLQPQEAFDAAYAENKVPEEFLKKEGVPIVWSWSAINRAGQWTNAPVCGFTAAAGAELLANKRFQPIKRWETAIDFWLRPEGSVVTRNYMHTSYPFSQIARHTQMPCSILVITRGTSTDNEWWSDIDARLEPFVLDNHEDWQLKAHRGISTLHNLIWPAAREWITETLLPECPKVNVTVTGHSLGGGMSTLWAARLADLLEGRLDRNGAVDAIILSSMRALSQKSIELVKQLPINLRAIASEMDLVIGLPCTASGSGMQLCDSRRSVGLVGEGIDEPFGDLWNEVLLTADYMTGLHAGNTYYNDDILGFIDATSLFSLKAYMQLPASLNTGVTHMCVPDCFAHSLASCRKKRGCARSTAAGVCPTGTDPSIPGLEDGELEGAKCYPTYNDVDVPCSLS